MFETLSDRLESVVKTLRGKGRLSEADIDATAREIRIALLEADVALPVVRQFIAAVKDRGGEVAHDGDRKSTRLNTSHPSNSYADFCLDENRRIERLQNLFSSGAA